MFLLVKTYVSVYVVYIIVSYLRKTVGDSQMYFKCACVRLLYTSNSSVGYMEVMRDLAYLQSYQTRHHNSLSLHYTN